MRSTLSPASPPPKNPTKHGPTEAQREGWFPRTRGEPRRQRIAMQWDRTQAESSDRATRNDSAAARAEPRALRLHSRPSSQNGSRRPDRRICDEWGSRSCAPTLWRGIQAAFSLDVRVAGAISSPWGARGGLAPVQGGSGAQRTALDTKWSDRLQPGTQVPADLVR